MPVDHDFTSGKRLTVPEPQSTRGPRRDKEKVDRLAKRLARRWEALPDDSFLEALERGCGAAGEYSIGQDAQPEESQTSLAWLPKDASFLPG